MVADRLPKASPGRFYELLNGTLEAMNFAAEVRAMCAPAYAEAMGAVVIQNQAEIETLGGTRIERAQELWKLPGAGGAADIGR